MRYDISVHSSEGGKRFAQRLKEDVQFRRRISESRRLRKGSDWIRIASKKGVEARQLIREKQNKIIKNRLLIRLKDKRTHLLIARLCGFLSGDGHIKIRIDKKGWHHHGIRFYPDNLDVANIFIKTFKELYEKEPSITPLHNFYRVSVTSKVACNHLLKISTYNTHNWDIPNFILNSKELKVEFLKAIFDCEASVGKNNIQFQSVNKKGIYEIKKLLEELNISNSVYSYKRTNPNWNINYILIISRKENIKRYAQLIGFNHPIKQQKLAKLADVPER